MHPFELNDSQLTTLLSAIQREVGVIIQPAQRAMLESRLGAFCRTHARASFDEVLDQCEHDAAMQARVVGALTNGETSFFRDAGVFSTLESVILPELVRQNRDVRRLRIWCAAASTGQEPHSVAMLLAERPALADWQVELWATDYAEQRLAVAREGVYTKLEINRGLPAQRLVRHFESADDRYRIKDSVRRRIRFERINLLQRWPALPQMDLILLRNVLIYWEPQNRIGVLERVRKQLSPEGFVLLGSAESPLGLGAKVALEPTPWPGFYRNIQRGGAP